MNSYVLMFNRLGKNSEKAQREGGGGIHPLVRPRVNWH